MALITWSDQYVLNIPTIDAQHKKLIGLINQLHDSMMRGEDKIMLEAILEGLIEYTETHFRFEEELFARYGYPEEASHKKEHEGLIGKVRDLERRLTGQDTTLTTDMMAFLKDWLTNHIQGSDRKYAPFLIEKGQK